MKQGMRTCGQKFKAQMQQHFGEANLKRLATLGKKSDS